MDSYLEKVIQYIKQIHISAEEKGEVYDALLLEINKSAGAVFFTRKRLSAAVASLLLLGSLGGVAFASEQALPGDVLYPIKTKVNEPVLRVLHSTTPESKANFETDILAQRLVEAEKLDAKNKLTDGAETQVTEGLSVQSKRVVNAVQVLFDTAKTAKNINDNKKAEKSAPQNTEQNTEQKITPEVGTEIKTDVASSSVSSSTPPENKNESLPVQDAIEHLDKVIQDHAPVIQKLDGENMPKGLLKRL